MVDISVVVIGVLVLILIVLLIVVWGIAIARRSMRAFRQGYREAFQPPTKAQPPDQPEPPVVREIVTREVVKVPCKYCGTLVELTEKQCPSCKAPVG